MDVQTILKVPRIWMEVFLMDYKDAADMSHIWQADQYQASEVIWYMQSSSLDLCLGGTFKLYLQYISIFWEYLTDTNDLNGFKSLV